MLVVRNVTEGDLDSLFDLIGKSELGLTTLLVSKETLEARIEQSIFAFNRKSAKPSGEPYVFVMEDLSNGNIVGTSAIYSKVGGYEPFYTYEIRNAIHESKELNVRNEIAALHIKSIHDGPTEIGSLFLAPEYWGRGLGRLLSMSRFLFMAEFPNRFEKEVIAEMRGVVDQDGTSPLWAAIGAHFYQIEFPRADTLSAESKKFIADLMPVHPIYVPLLPPGAQQVIGNVHKNTEPALALLKKEGFEFRNNVDIFDGGPTVHCDFEKIRPIAQSRSGTITEIGQLDPSSPEFLVSNARLDFRCCEARVEWHSDDTATVDEITALRLNLKKGDSLRTVNPKPSK